MLNQWCSQVSRVSCRLWARTLRACRAMPSIYFCAPTHNICTVCLSVSFVLPVSLGKVGWPLISKRVQQFLSSPSTTLTATVSVICSPLARWYDPSRGFTTRLICSTRELAVAFDCAVKEFGEKAAISMYSSSSSWRSN